MIDMPDNSGFTRLAQKVAPDARLVRVWPLAGGYSAQVTGFEIEHPDGRHEKFVARQHGPADLARNPNIATDEFSLLTALRAAGLPVPSPIVVEASGDIYTTPVIVVTFVEGVCDFAPPDVLAVADEMAVWLARIHAVSASGLSFLPRQATHVDTLLNQRPAVLNTALAEVREALAARWPWPQSNPDSLLHGDFWPGNLLRHNDTLTAIIDWEDAAIGDPLADLSTCRLETLWAYGPDAMVHLTERYRALCPHLDYTQLASWDLFAALKPAAALPGWDMPPDIRQRMGEQLVGFARQALAALTTA